MSWRVEEVARAAAHDEVERWQASLRGIEATLGEVTDTSPLTIRFAGDDQGTEGVIAATHLSLTTGDEVVLLRVGAGWIAIAELP